MPYVGLQYKRYSILALYNNYKIILQIKPFGSRLMSASLKCWMLVSVSVMTLITLMPVSVSVCLQMSVSVDISFL